MSSASKGRENENRSVDYLEKKGYYCIKSENSYGKFDIIAFNLEDVDKPLVVLVQSKTNLKYTTGLVSDLGVIAGLLRTQLTARMISENEISVEIHNWLPYAREPEITKV